MCYIISDNDELSNHSTANEVPCISCKKQLISYDFTAFTRLYHHLSKKAIDHQKPVAFLRCMIKRK